MLYKKFDIQLTQIQLNSFKVMFASFGDCHDMESPDNGGDLLYGVNSIGTLACLLTFKMNISENPRQAKTSNFHSSTL